MSAIQIVWWCCIIGDFTGSNWAFQFSLHIGHKQRYSHIIDLIVMHKNNKYQMPAELKVALVGAKGVGKVPSLCTLYVYLWFCFVDLLSYLECVLD